MGELPYYLTLGDKLNKFSTSYKGFKSTHEEESTYVALPRLHFNYFITFSPSLIFLNRGSVNNFGELLISYKTSGDELGVKIECFGDLFPPAKQFLFVAGGAVLVNVVYRK